MNIQLPALPFIFPAKPTAGPQHPLLMFTDARLNNYEVASGWWTVEAFGARYYYFFIKKTSEYDQ